MISSRVKRDQWRPYVVGEGALDRVQIVRADGHERAATANVLVELVLQVDEAIGLTTPFAFR
jgi:hypothetical protein